MAAGIMQQFINGLKSRSEDLRLKAARDLHHYVNNLTLNSLQPLFMLIVSR